MIQPMPLSLPSLDYGEQKEMHKPPNKKRKLSKLEDIELDLTWKEAVERVYRFNEYKTENKKLKKEIVF